MIKYAVIDLEYKYKNLEVYVFRADFECIKDAERFRVENLFYGDPQNIQVVSYKV